MIEYLDSVLQALTEHLGTTADTPAADHLFKVRNERETKYLPEEQA